MKWQKAFHFSQEQLRQFEQQKPPDVTTLMWLLEMGKIKEQEYLAWAKKEYNLPVLKDDYFQKSKVNFNWLQKHYHFFKSAEAMAPLTQLKGKTYVACLEPLENPPWDFETQWVLCSYSSLKTYMLFLKKSLKPKDGPKKECPEMEPYILSDEKKKLSKSEILMRDVFKSLHEKFAQVLFLDFNKNKMLRCLRCDDNWSVENFSEAMKPINLKAPSIFQILNKTSRPFHGPVSPSEENHRFFKAWGYDGELPEHVTAVPVFSDVHMEKVLGFLLCTGSSQCFDTNHLIFVKKE